MTGRRRHIRRGPERLFAGIGLVAIVALIIFVYVSYTANNGLPFAPAYTIRADVGNADLLIKTDEVRIAGIRVGQVSGVTARVRRGVPYAQLTLALSPSAGPLPVDTRVQILSASILGATYVDLAPGTSRRRVPNGGTLPLHDATSTVQLTDLLDIFNHATAQNIQDGLSHLGDSVAGQGDALNTTFGSLAALLPPVSRVSQTLAAPATGLAQFLRGYEAFVAAIAPVSSRLASLVSGAATTFGALANVRPALAATIEAFPPAETALTDALNGLDPSLNTLANVAAGLRAAGRLLPGALTVINTTLQAGVRPADELPTFAGHLTASLRSLNTLSRAPSTGGAVRKLTDTLTSAATTLNVLTPAQVYCNVLGIFGLNFASSFGELGTGNGPSIADIGVTTAGALGEELQNAKPSPNVAINYLPTENSKGCVSGNEPYTGRQSLSNPPGVTSTNVPNTSPPPGVTALARRAGLLNAPLGTP